MIKVIRTSRFSQYLLDRLVALNVLGASALESSWRQPRLAVSAEACALRAPVRRATVDVLLRNVLVALHTAPGLLCQRHVPASRCLAEINLVQLPLHRRQETGALVVEVAGPDCRGGGFGIMAR